MGAIFGALTAMGIGLSDLFGRRVVNASHALTATAVVQLVAIITSVAVLGIVDGDPLRRDLAVGLVSGLGLGGGLSLYFGGLARSTSTVVAPIVATLSAIIPFTYAAVTGSTPSLSAILGAALAFAGLAVITVAGGRAAHVRSGVAWGLASGLSYGFGLTVIIEATEASGAWPAVTQRVGALALVAAAARAARVPVVPPRGFRRAAALSGIFAGLSTVFYLLGVQADATVAVVTASTFPAFTVAVGWLVFGDSVSRVQLFGLTGVLVGVAAVVTL
jgi:drug/metabolite transporter (DMT)-like permease